MAGLQTATRKRLFAGAGGFVAVLAARAIANWYPLSLALMLPVGFTSIIFNQGLVAMHGEGRHGDDRRGVCGRIAL